MNDISWMKRALELAQRGRGSVEPNPLVGAVLVHDGNVVGEGWHEQYGQAHAEVNALRQAGDRARGSTLYVTLEPCCHHGKTPPCTDAVIAAGVARVCAAMEDPFPQVAGQGASLLKAAGIPIDFGICAEEARRLNAPYLKGLATGKPYVHGKWAMTLDGKICTRTGDARWISGEASRARVHELRGRMDGIVVGLGTVLADDPLLTARPPGPRVACRVVLDSGARTPLDGQLAKTAGKFPTLIVTSADAPPEKVARLTAAGCEVLAIRADGAGHPSPAALLEEMGRRRWTNILVEGGSAVLGSFLDGGALDEVHIFLGQRLIGGKGAKSPIAGKGSERIADGMTLLDPQFELIEGDVYLRGILHRY